MDIFMTLRTMRRLSLYRTEHDLSRSASCWEALKGARAAISRIFSVMHYLQPIKFSQLSLHLSANVGIDNGDVTLFFGLSGTGKTPSPQTRTGSSSATTSTSGPTRASSISRAGATSSASTSRARRSPRSSRRSASGPSSRRSCTAPRRAGLRRREHHREHALRDPIEFLTCDAYGVLPPVSKL
ncbi:hypothetical protein JB92DRAFT_2953266 [Gautieria morchelliformis]|nr:hypothetical protein JB92DRAFT_2953266 [Gautieria morchelliformis]